MYLKIHLKCICCMNEIDMNENFILDQKLKSIIIINVKMCTLSIN